jgi:hypothetical protein
VILAVYFVVLSWPFRSRVTLKEKFAAKTPPNPAGGMGPGVALGAIVQACTFLARLPASRATTALAQNTSRCLVKNDIRVIPLS